MPEEVNIDELLDLKTDEERTHRLQVTVPPMCYTQPGRRTGALGGQRAESQAVDLRPRPCFDLTL